MMILNFWQKRSFFAEFILTKSITIRKSNHVIVDIGANIGVFALQMEKVAPGVKVFCFEAADRTFLTLTKNIKTNNLDNSIILFKCAVAGCQPRPTL